MGLKLDDAQLDRIQGRSTRSFAAAATGCSGQAPAGRRTNPTGSRRLRVVSTRSPRSLTPLDTLRQFPWDDAPHG